MHKEKRGKKKKIGSYMFTCTVSLLLFVAVRIEHKSRGRSAIAEEDDDI
jgi:hypothetical protein